MRMPYIIGSLGAERGKHGTFCVSLVYVTPYGKRDHSGFFVESAFLVWIVSATSPEFNGASLKEKYYSEAELWLFICTRVAHRRQIFFGETGVFIPLPVLSVYVSRKAVYGLA